MKYFFLIALIAFLSCNNDAADSSDDNQNAGASAPPVINYSVLNVYPHDTSSYTQGLIWYNNSLYEGTGEIGHSKLMKVDLKSGKAEKRIDIDQTLFGEGITILNNQIFQLTWQHHKVLVYDLNFRKLKEFSWPHEGWGITHNGSQLIISTGSSNLYYVNPADFKIQKVIGVTDANGPVGNLNELEFANGVVYANIYETNYIVKIDPASGKVLGRMDLTDILTKNNISVDPNHIDVLNGIAFDSAKNSFYITGKWWPALFEVKLN